MGSAAEEAAIVQRGLGNERRASQNGRRWSNHRERVGIISEREMAHAFGREPDLTSKPGGDGGVDMWLPVDLYLPLRVMYPIDAKGAQSAPFLLVDVGKVRMSTIYMLVEVDVEADKGKIIGWEWGRIVMRAPTRNWCNNGVWVHFIRAEKLRPLQELLDRYAPEKTV